MIVSLAGLGSYFQSSRIVIPDQVPVPSAAHVPARERLVGLWRLIVANRPFVGFELRGFVYVLSIGLSMPVLPLFYVSGGRRAGCLDRGHSARPRPRAASSATSSRGSSPGDGAPR